VRVAARPAEAHRLVEQPFAQTATPRRGIDQVQAELGGPRAAPAGGDHGFHARTSGCLPASPPPATPPEHALPPPPPIRRSPPPPSPPPRRCARAAPPRAPPAARVWGGDAPSPPPPPPPSQGARPGPAPPPAALDAPRAGGGRFTLLASVRHPAVDVIAPS